MRLRSIKYLWLALIWAVIVFVLSSVSGDSFNNLPKFKIPHFDKFIHFNMYFLLTCLLTAGFKQIKTQNIFSKYPLMLSFIISFVYGSIIEIMQEYIFVSRSMDIYDLIANCVGIFTGIIFSLSLKYILK